MYVCVSRLIRKRCVRTWAVITLALIPTLTLALIPTLTLAQIPTLTLALIPTHNFFVHGLKTPDPRSGQDVSNAFVFAFVFDFFS